MKTRIWSGEHCISPWDQKSSSCFDVFLLEWLFSQSVHHLQIPWIRNSFAFFLNLKAVCTDKAQPLVENILHSVNPPTDEVDGKLMVGDEQRDEWFIVDDNMQLSEAYFTESKDDAILGFEWIPRDLCS